MDILYFGSDGSNTRKIKALIEQQFDTAKTEITWDDIHQYRLNVESVELDDDWYLFLNKNKVVTLSFSFQLKARMEPEYFVNLFDINRSSK